MEKKFIFNRDFQIRILALACQDFPFLNLINDLVLPEYFDDRVLSWYFKMIQEYFLDYRKKPTLVILERELENAIQRKRIKEGEEDLYRAVLTRITELLKEPLDESEYIIKETIRFCKRQSVRKTLLEVAPLTDSEDEDIWDQIESKVRKACDAGNSSLEIGTNYFKTISQRIADRLSFEEYKIIPTGIRELDNHISGGLKAGQLGVVVGSSGFGKSILSAHFGKYAVINGYKVVHYTLELNEKDVCERYDAAFSSIPVRDLIPKSKDLEKKLNKLATKYNDSLIIKFYPTGTATVATIRNHLNQIRGQGFEPDLVVIDYLDLLKSSANYSDEYTSLGEITKDIRGLAGEFNIPIWSPTQTNRAGMSAELPGMEHVGDSIKKVQIADILVAICMTKEERLNNEARLHIAKNRNGPTNVIVHLKTAFDKMKFQDLGITVEEEEEEVSQKKFRRKPNPKDELLGTAEE